MRIDKGHYGTLAAMAAIDQIIAENSIHAEAGDPKEGQAPREKEEARPDRKEAQAAASAGEGTREGCEAGESPKEHPSKAIHLQDNCNCNFFGYERFVLSSVHCLASVASDLQPRPRPGVAARERDRQVCGRNGQLHESEELQVGAVHGFLCDVHIPAASVR